LDIACTKVIAEQKLITDAAKLKWQKFQSEKAKIVEQQEKAKARLPKLKDMASVAYLTAQPSSSWTNGAYPLILVIPRWYSAKFLAGWDDTPLREVS
jgi:hypothetical protein